MPVPAITKKALAESMKRLMENKAFSKISVGDICAQCGMSRKSFYYHFKDKYELVNWIFYTELIAFFERSGDMDEHTLVQTICSYLYANRAFYSNAFHVEGQNSFTEFFQETLESFAYESFQSRIADTGFRDFFCAFLSAAVRESVIRWLKESSPMPPNMFADLLERTFSYIGINTAQEHRT